MLREADKFAGLILTPDQDEQFEPGIRDDLATLLASDRGGARVPLQNGDRRRRSGASLPQYAAHESLQVAAGAELSSLPWLRRIAAYADRRQQLAAGSRILHYCYYTPELRRQRRLVGN